MLFVKEFGCHSVAAAMKGQESEGIAISLNGMIGVGSMNTNVVGVQWWCWPQEGNR